MSQDTTVVDIEKDLGRGDVVKGPSSQGYGFSSGHVWM